MTQIPVALVTGAGSGMGASTMHAFQRHGWHVLAVDVTPVEASPCCTPIVVDVRDRAALEEALTTVLPSVGPLRAVANIAGIYPPSTLTDFTPDLFHRIMDINVLGVLNVMAAAAPWLSEGDSIVNFASVDGYTVSPGQLIYGMSKAAVIMATKSVALELAPRRIRVNAIAPGWVATPGNAATGRMAAAVDAIPLGRVADPSEIAEWVWLLTGGGAASFMTGETLTLSGGDVIR
jgi:NAD(P)-dependent dehydrogenase (short-subunit alcohol dehydrogenase family)